MNCLMLHALALIAGIVLDIIVGDPHGLPHPIRAIGKLVALFEKALYRSKRAGAKVAAGALLWAVTLIVTTLVTGAVFVGAYLINPYAGLVAESILVFYILAAGSLKNESMKVYDRIEKGDAEGARDDLSMIVGRDTKELDEPGIIRAAVETVAENTSDGVIAPLIYCAITGPVGGMIYKAVNTMDSMIGYRNERYEYFGKVAARADDVFNILPSRISALFMIAASFLCGLFDKNCSGRGAFAIWLRDRYAHKSPNSAQTESVCAGALSIRLGGDSAYGGRLVKKPYIGDDKRPVEKEDIKRACRLMFASYFLAAVIIEIILFVIVSKEF